MLLGPRGSLGFLDGVQPQLHDSSGVGRMRIGSIPSDHKHQHRMFGIVLDLLEAGTCVSGTMGLLNQLLVAGPEYGQTIID